MSVPLAPDSVPFQGSPTDVSAFYDVQKDMPALKKRRLTSLIGARGVWSLRVPRMATARVPDKDTVLVVDEDHESGHTKVSQMDVSQSAWTSRP